MIPNTPYTYLVKHIPSSRVYYGVRFAKNCVPDDLFVTYFTSSKEIKQLIKNDGINAFEVEIRQTFTDSMKARMWELKVLQRMNVIHNPKFINKTDNTSIILPPGSPSPRLGITLSQNTRDKISCTKLGVKLTDEHKTKLKIARAKQVRSPMSAQQKLKISNTKLTSNYVDTIETRNKKSESAKNRPTITSETRKKLSKAKKGIIKTKIHLQKILDTKQKKKQYILAIILFFLCLQI